MALRDTTVAIFFDVDGEKQVRDLDEEIERTAGSAEEMGAEAEEAGSEMEEAGREGERAFQGTAASLEQVKSDLTEVGALTGAAFAGGAAVETFAVTQFGQIEEARTRVQALGRERGNELVAQAQQVRDTTASLVSAEEALRGQSELLSRGIPAQTIEQVTPALATIATTMEDDLMTVFDRFGDPLKEAVGGFEEVVNAGPLSAETFIQQAQALGLNVKTLQDFNEEMDKSVARQALANAIRIEANNRREAAAEIQDTVNARTTAAINTFERFGAVMGEDVGEVYKDLIETGRQWILTLIEQEPSTVTSIGNMVALGTVAAGTASAVLAGAAALSFFGSTSLAVAGAVGILAIPLIDLTALLLTGKPLLFDWAQAMEDLDKKTQGWWNTLQPILDTLPGFFGVLGVPSDVATLQRFMSDGESDTAASQGGTDRAGRQRPARNSVSSVFERREAIQRNIERNEVLPGASVGEGGLGGLMNFDITVNDQGSGERTPEESRRLAQQLADEMEERLESSLAGAF